MKTDTLAPSNLSQWEHPSHYFGATWEGYYVFLSQNRDSDALTRSNFRCGLAAIGGEVGAIETDTGEEIHPVTVVRESHWACGWIEWIAIHESNVEALRIANRIMEKLEDYPVIDEDDWSEEEDREANQIWRNCYDERDRIHYMREHSSQFEFRDFADLRSQVRGAYFGGYASDLCAR